MFSTDMVVNSINTHSKQINRVKHNVYMSVKGLQSVWQSFGTNKSLNWFILIFRETPPSCGEAADQSLPVTQRNAVKRRKTTFRFCTQGGSAAWHPTAPWLTLTDGRPSPWTGSRSWSGRGSAPRRLRLSASRRSRRTKWPSCSGLSGATRAKEKLWTCSQWMRISSAGAR